MKKLISVLIAAMFAAASFSVAAQSSDTTGASTDTPKVEKRAKKHRKAKKARKARKADAATSSTAPAEQK